MRLTIYIFTQINISIGDKTLDYTKRTQQNTAEITVGRITTHGREMLTRRNDISTTQILTTATI